MIRHIACRLAEADYVNLKRPGDHMRKMLLAIIAVAMLLGGTLNAQDIAGDWQGTLKIGDGLRIILHIVKGDNGGWNGVMYSIDQSTDGIPVSSLTIQGSDLKFSVQQIRGSFEGKLSPDGNSIAGTWTQGAPLPLDLQRATKETAWPIDAASHTVSFVTVDRDVKLEVVDWGGSGRPVVLLSGLGNNAHVYDKFAPKLTSTYHVYGITRRGFGASSKPPLDNGNYTADRLGDDVLAVLASLKIDKPVLVGHSIAGEELSSIGSRHPEKVAGLIYLDASFPYAFYNAARGDFLIDLIELRKKLDLLMPGMAPNDTRVQEQELLQTTLPQFERDLKDEQKMFEFLPPLPPQNRQPPSPATAIRSGEQKYTEIHVPILAIVAVPHNFGPNYLKDNPTARAAAVANDLERAEAQATAFEKALPTARVVRLPNADHYVFRSNEVDVLREMNAFIASLPK
jgi:pimeloyl-ACP methyl ester carboxylesterase